jgi:hypothetical protein
MRRKQKFIQTATFEVPERELKSVESYRPHISIKQMQRLRLMKRESGRPITELVAEALDEYFETRVKNMIERG